MIHDKDTVGFYISPGKHGRIQREKYAASGQPFKIAMSFGHDPLTFLAGSIEVPYGVQECDFIGGVRGSLSRSSRANTPAFLFPRPPRLPSRVTSFSISRAPKAPSASGPAITPATHG